MSHVPRWRRYARLFGADVKGDVADELGFHIDAKTEDLVQAGWPYQAAREEARRRFGDARALQQLGEEMGLERARSNQRNDTWEAFRQDLRFALRTLMRDRAFTFITVVILALGIAANTAVFSVVHAILLRPVPFPDSHELVWMYCGRKLPPSIRKAAGLSGITYRVDAFEDFARQNRSFQSITSYNPFLGNSEFTVTGAGEPRTAPGVMVAQNFFQTLGVKPQLGRYFTKEECQRGGGAAVLLSDGFWKRQFGADPGILGKAVTLNKRSFTVVGVLPRTFDFGAVFSPGLSFDVFVPAVMDELRNWGNTLALVGRLKPGVSLQQAQAEADLLFEQIGAAHKDWQMSYVSTLTSLKEFVSGKLRGSFLMLWCAVGLVLLIVCVNVSNLLLARASGRSKEFAMRAALGAERTRLLRQLFTESLVLATAGAVLGFAGAFAITTFLAHRASIALPLLSSVRLDGAALAWTIGLSVLVTLVFGLVPACKLASGDLQETLKSSGHGFTAGRKQETVRTAMAIAEISVACVLVVTSGLLLRSFLRVLEVNLGFRPSHAAVIKIDYEGKDGAQRGAVLQELLRKVTAIPGVQAAGVADMLPLGRNRSWDFAVKGKIYPKNVPGDLASVRIVTPGYLNAMGMHLESGRDFSWSDSARSQHVVIMNRAAARDLWPNQDPLGRIVYLNGETRLIGVVSDVREHSLEASAEAELYLPVTQADPEGAELVLRSALPPDTLQPSVMAALRSLNPAQPATELQPLQGIVDRAVSPRRFFVLFICSFGALALLLASLGIYGVISYSVTQQRRQIGIRMALGASARTVQGEVLKRCLGMALAGIVVGLVLSLAAGKTISSLLFGTTPLDLLPLASAALLIAAIALAAGFVPARRAAKIDPIATLRNS